MGNSTVNKENYSLESTMFTKAVSDKMFDKNRLVRVESLTGALNFPPYHKGEVLHSYLYKTTVANGFDTVEYFLESTQSYKSRRIGKIYFATYDSMVNFTDTLHFKDNFDWLSSGTLFNALYSFLPSPEVRLHEYTVNTVLRRKSFTVEPLIPELYSCPMCRKEEGKAWYYHTEHQMPFLTFCPKHKVRLERFTGVRYHEHGDDISFKMVEEGPCDERLSDFSSAIYKENIDCGINGIIDTIETHLRDKSFNKYCRMPSISDRKPLLTGIPTILIDDFMKKRIPLPCRYTLQLIAYLFPTVEEFLSSIPKTQSHFDEFNKVITGRFEMLTEYSERAVMLRCLDCGSVFYVNPPSFIRKPSCIREERRYA